MKKLILLALAMGLLSGACSNPETLNKEIHLAQVDSLVTVVDFLSARVDEPNEEMVAQVAPKAKENYLVIAQKVPNQQDKEFWIKEVNPITQMSEAFEKFLKDKPGLEEGLENSRHKLQTLRNSIEDEKLNDSLAQRYILDERAALAELHLKVNKRVPKVKAALVLWDSTKAHYDSLAQALQKQ